MEPIARPLLICSQIVSKVLREIALERKDEPGLDYAALKERLSAQRFNEAQKGLLDTRLQLLESFMDVPSLPKAPLLSEVNMKVATEEKRKKALLRNSHETYQQNKRALIKGGDIWSFEAESLTIVDLSCPFVDESAACLLFNICIAIFLEDRGDVGRIVVLDEAHKV